MEYLSVRAFRNSALGRILQLDLINSVEDLTLGEVEKEAQINQKALDWLEILLSNTNRENIDIADFFGLDTQEGGWGLMTFALGDENSPMSSLDRYSLVYLMTKFPIFFSDYLSLTKLLLEKGELDTLELVKNNFKDEIEAEYPTLDSVWSEDPEEIESLKETYRKIFPEKKV